MSAGRSPNFVKFGTLFRRASLHDVSMLRAFIFLLSPVVTAGLIYWFGWMALAGCLALVLCTLLFSSGTRRPNFSQTEDDTLSSYGTPTTFRAGL